MIRERLIQDQLTFVRPGSGRFQIGSDSLEKLMFFAQHKPYEAEAGGVLLGRHILETNDIVVDKVTTPMQDDFRRRSFFFRSRRLHQKITDQAWEESGGTCTYLGEWHTHSEPLPTPSIIDKLNWYRKMMVDEFSNFIFFVIVGTESVCVWEGRYRHLHLCYLKEIESDVRYVD